MFETLARWVHPANPVPLSYNVSPPTPDTGLPQRMQNLDVVDGLARCMNNGVLLQRLLSGFMAGQAKEQGWIHPRARARLKAVQLGLGRRACFRAAQQHR